MQKFIEPQMVKIIHQKPEKIMTIEMVHLPKGEFMFGEGENQEKVVMDYEFEMGKYAVTIEEYMNFVEDTKTHYPEWLKEGSKYNIETGSDEHYKNINQSLKAPIVGISWHDAVAYCEWLSSKGNQNYRLPTEKEWEYTCRAGTETKWSFGDDEKELEKYAWYDKNLDNKTHIVGKKEPNPWGLYDMHGNVWEWCEDDFVDNYDNTPRDGTANKKGSRKVVRGGSWLNNADDARSADRYGVNPSGRSVSVGFRLLRTLP